MANEIVKTDLGAALQEQAPDFLKKLNKKQRHELAQALGQIEGEYSISIQQSIHHSGPLPAPETLQGYAEIIPDGAERIMVMAESQSEHRRSLEQEAVKSQLKQSERGQIFAAILSVLLIVVGVTAFLTGHDGVAGTIFGVTITGLVTIFIVGKRKEQKNLKSKRD